MVYKLNSAVTYMVNTLVSIYIFQLNWVPLHFNEKGELVLPKVTFT